MCTYVYHCRPYTMWQDFKGGIYLDELAEICGDISRAAGFQGAVTFQGNSLAIAASLNCWLGNQLLHPYIECSYNTIQPRKSSQGEIFRQFHYLLTLVKILSTNFFSCVKDCIAGMVTFTALAKFKNYYNTKIAGLGESFIPRKFSAM